ncbi:MAG TPA: response regulator [Planctomycetota bacterium]
MKALRPVLLVEDNDNDILLFRRALAKIQSDLPLQVIRDGQDAWDQLSSGGAERPSLILLDLKLPRLSGLDLLRAIKRDPELRTLPVVVVTSSRRQADIDEVYAEGADFYLLKPVDFQRVMEQARGIHAYWTAIVGHPDDPLADPTLSQLRKLSELASPPA